MMTDGTRPAGIALVAGGSGAIGRAVVDRLTEQGWPVLATHRSGAPGGGPGSVTWVHFDSAQEGSGNLRSVLEELRLPLAAMFFCIGAPSGKRAVADTSVAEYAEVYAANVLSFVNLWHTVQVVARRSGARVVAVGSSAADTLSPGNGAYSAAKSALTAAAVTLAREECRHGVRVNVVAPSLIDSPLARKVRALARHNDPASETRPLPWGRPLTLGEVSRVVVDVGTHPQWDYLSGQVIRLQAPIPPGTPNG